MLNSGDDILPGNANHLPALIEKGVRGFNCFLFESGVDEFPYVNEAKVCLAMDKMMVSEKRWRPNMNMKKRIVLNILLELSSSIF